MSTAETPPAGGLWVGPGGPKEAGLEVAPGSRPCSETPPVPDKAALKLGVLERLPVPRSGSRARGGAPPE
eukprot:15431988-Alexandrium_andersonii.AAC.1